MLTQESLKCLLKTLLRRKTSKCIFTLLIFKVSVKQNFTDYRIGPGVS